MLTSSLVNEEREVRVMGLPPVSVLRTAGMVQAPQT